MYSTTDRTPFRCPICRSQFFGSVVVARPGGGKYRTEFYECSGCSVMFRDPVKFTKFEPYVAPVVSAEEKRRKEQKLAYFEGQAKRN